MSVDLMIKKAIDTAKQVVANVETSRYGDPTPCTERNVKDMANHMTGFLVMTEVAARKQPAMDGSGEVPDLVGDNPGPVYAGLADKAAAAWSAPGALQGTTEFGPVGLVPVEVAAGITLMEIAVHAWDLAAGSGQSYQMDPEVAEATWQAVQQVVTDDARKRGAFAAKVAVPADASTQDRILGFTGRDPAWSA